MNVADGELADLKKKVCKDEGTNTCVQSPII